MIVANGERELPDLQRAIEARGSCTARLLQTLPVRARRDDNSTLDVVVHVYELTGCVMTNRAYAWFTADTAEIIVHTALDIGPIRSPATAVHATLADHDRRSKLARRGLQELALA